MSEGVLDPYTGDVRRSAGTIPLLQAPRARVKSCVSTSGPDSAIRSGFEFQRASLSRLDSWALGDEGAKLANLQAASKEEARSKRTGTSQPRISVPGSINTFL